MNTFLYGAAIYIVIGVMITCLISLFGGEHRERVIEQIEKEFEHMPVEVNMSTVLDITIVLFWPMMILGGLFR